jgi:exonuclease SbcD
MKLMHIGDLHIGKRVNEYSMLEDQKYILGQMLNIADHEKVDAIMIAGDVYDKNVPTGEAVEVLDDFLTEFAKRKIKVYMISGNHDSQERLNFGSRIMDKNGIHIEGVFSGKLKKYKVADASGDLNIFLLPFIKPAMVAPFFKEEEINSYEKAVEVVIKNSDVNVLERNILIAHQFVVAGDIKPETCESENISVGGVDDVNYSIFDDFDYVALGHLHASQHIGRESVRYSGSPVKYSFSESRHNKTVTIIELFEKGNIKYNKIPIIPIRDLREIKGSLKDLLDPSIYSQANQQDYIHVTLTDEDEVMDAIGKLKLVYPNIMKLDFENKRSKVNENSKTAASGDVSLKRPIELFSEFYKNQNNVELTQEEVDIMQQLFEQIGSESL